MVAVIILLTTFVNRVKQSVGCVCLCVQIITDVITFDVDILYAGSPNSGCLKIKIIGQSGLEMKVKMIKPVTALDKRHT